MIVGWFHHLVVGESDRKRSALVPCDQLYKAIMTVKTESPPLSHFPENSEVQAPACLEAVMYLLTLFAIRARFDNIGSK